VAFALIFVAWIALGGFFDTKDQYGAREGESDEVAAPE
jgi:hypothetical protein